MIVSAGGIHKNIVGIYLCNLSSKKKDPKPKLFGPDIFGWGGCLPREGVGPKVRYVLRNPGKPNFLARYPSDSVKRHLSRRHLSVLNFKLNLIFNGGCTGEEQIALSLKRHLFPHGSRKPKAFWICFSTLPPILNIFPIFRAQH